MTDSKAMVSGQADRVGRKATEETPIGATEAADHPEMAVEADPAETAVEADPAAEETAAMEQEAEMTDGSLPNPSHKTLTTTTTEPKGRKSHHPDHPEGSLVKGQKATQGIATAMMRLTMNS